MRMKKLFLILAVLTGIFIFYISSLSSPPSPKPGNELIPILYHFGIFFLFAEFLILSTNFKKKELSLVLFIAIIYAVLDELHQFFVPYRACTIFDISIDCTGVLFAFIFYAVYYKISSMNRG